MITIKKGQILKDNPDLEVLSPSGDYGEDDLIECTKIGESEPYCMFGAQYVVNGNNAYDAQ